jgi:CRP-like cAMP-binding protein
MKKSMASSADWVPPLNAIPFLKERAGAAKGPILLTERQRQELARIGTRVGMGPRTIIYREDAPAMWVFAVTEGTVKTYRELPSGKRTIAAFLFAHDLFGLAENGRYTNTAQAITRVTLYRLPLAELAALLKHDGELQFEFLVKITHELREAQRRDVMLNRRDAAGRLAMFVAWMHTRQTTYTAGPIDGISLPMTRSDIAAFLGLSLESVSRAAAELERRRVITFEGRHRAQIVNTSALAKLLTSG